MDATFIGGVALENHGYVCTGLIALVIGGVAYIFNGIISFYPDNFNDTLFILMAVLFLCIGIGIGTNYIFALTISLKNVSCASGGKVVAILTVSMYVSNSLISWFSSSSNRNFAAYIVAFTVLHIFTSLLGIFCMREIVHEHVKTNNTEVNPKSDCDQLSEKQTEKMALTPKSNKYTQSSSSYYGDKHGLDIMSITDFWLLAFTFIMSISIDKTFFMNGGTYLRSFGQENHLQLVTTTGPLVGLAYKLFTGLLSDACIQCIPRIWFFLIPAILKFGILILFLFMGDNIVVFMLTTYVTYISLAAMFLIGPVLFGEYFGMKYYGRNYGSTVFASGVVTLILHVLLGVLYDWQISGTDLNATCSGLKCFYWSTIFLIILTFLTLCTSISLWKRTPKEVAA